MQLDVVIIDTAGRLHIDEELMHELSNIKNGVNPQNTTCSRFYDRAGCS